MKETRGIYGERLWTKYFVLLLAMSFFANIIQHMQTAALPLYIKNIGGENATIGIATSIFTLSALLFRPLVGNYLDTKGRRIILIAGIIILSFSSLSYSFAHAVGILLFIRFLHGVGSSAQITATGTMTADIVPAARLGEGVSYTVISNLIAVAVGPVLGLYLMNQFSYNMFFYACFGFGAIACIFSIFVNYEQKKQEITNARFDNKKKPTKGAFIEKSALPPSVVMFFIALTSAGVFTFISAYAAFRGVKDVGMFFLCYSHFFQLGIYIRKVRRAKIGDCGSCNWYFACTNR